MSQLLPLYGNNQNGRGGPGGPIGYTKWSPGYEGFIGDTLQKGWDSYGGQMQNAMGTIGAVAQGNAARQLADKQQLRGITSQMGMLPLDIMPNRNPNQINTNGLPVDMNNWFDANVEMRNRLDSQKANSPLYKNQMAMMTDLMKSLFGGGQGGGMGSLPTSFSTNFGASGGFQ